ncbi:DUF6082 family protein [Streptomyces sp. NPDC051561]|uniref:DUF6082 family protein n=1 Tax=Streptomyces sp. NPDC051561 TaxID=3365658 RepID=UPI0037A4DCF0
MSTQEQGAQRGVTTGLAFGAAVVALMVQRRQLHRRTEMAAKHRLQFDVLCKAMDDPVLAQVLDTYEDSVRPEEHRQFLFANALYGNLLHAYRLGTTNLDETLGHLRGICQNHIFRDYWDATRHHRESLPAGSQERLLAAQVDEIVARASEAQDRWWIA